MFNIQKGFLIHWTWFAIKVILTSSISVPIHNNITFLGQYFQASEWALVKTATKCWTNHGRWDMVNRFVMNSSLNYEQNYNRESPCYHYTKKVFCYHILDGNASNYMWQVPPKQCSHEIKPFSVDGLCKMKHKGNIMILGDSMNELLVEVLKNHVVREKLYFNQTCQMGNEKRFTIKCGEESPPMTVTSARNDLLSLNNITYFNSSTNTWQQPWLHLLTKHNISILILIRGAHYAIDDILLHAVKQTIQHIRAFYPHISIIWRNTPFGHYDNIRHFFAPPLLHSEMNTSTYHLHSKPGYHYGDFKHQNTLVHNMLRVEFPEVLYIDVFTPTVLRTDSHMDALHYCSIGPLSDWLNLIYNALLVINEFVEKKMSV